jgi:hypothetical protein
MATHRQHTPTHQPDHRTGNRPSQQSLDHPRLLGLTATLERLHTDRQLEEALVHGPDPLHLTAVFGIHEQTAIRYAHAARQILEQGAEQHDSGSPRT